MRERAGAVLALARELGDPLLEAAAWPALAHAEQNMRDIPASIAAAARSAAILDALDDGDCAPLLETFWWLASAEDVLERWERLPAPRRARHAPGAQLRRELRVRGAHAHAGRDARLAGRAGARPRGRARRPSTRRTCRATRRRSPTRTRPSASSTRGPARRARRCAPASWRSRRRARCAAGCSWRCRTRTSRAALLEAGEPERARAQLQEARARGALDHWVGRCWWEIWMCEAELALGRLDEAERWARAGRRPPRTRWACRAAARGAHAPQRAAVLLAQGRRTEAPRPRAGARLVELADGGSPRRRRPRARSWRGARWRGRSRADGAVAELERARGALVEAGAPRLADGAARELRKLGLRVARRGAQGDAVRGRRSLSAREREIAELVATGRTNREIADGSHLSEKTVENHLGRVFTKLDISSRAALAGLVGRERRRLAPAGAAPARHGAGWSWRRTSRARARRARDPAPAHPPLQMPEPHPDAAGPAPPDRVARGLRARLGPDARAASQRSGDAASAGR